MSKIHEKKEKKRKALVEAAYTLLSEKGVADTSISDIVARAGVAKGTFYLYFNDKYDIINSLVYEKTSTIFGKAISSLEKVKTFNIFDEMHYIANNIIDQLSDDSELLEYFSKAIDWNEFINVIKSKKDSGDVDCLRLYDNFIMKYNKSGLRDPEVMIFLILEFIVCSCYSPIKNNKPCSLVNIKPYIFNVITAIINLHLNDNGETLK